MSKSALIFGASGVSGWAIVNEILQDYPKRGTWGKVVALTNRPLKQSDSLWPDDERLKIVSGIDLLNASQEEIERDLSQIEGIENITHVYYTAYKASTNFGQEYQDADIMLQRAVIAMDRLSSALEFIVLQTGGKWYGFHLLGSYPANKLHTRHKESEPRLPSPYAEGLFYHAQFDFLNSYAKNKKWNWCDTRPNVIIGFVPNQNFYSIGTSLAVYLSLWSEVEGRGSICPFPGTKETFLSKSHESSSDMIARQSLHLSLSLPPTAKGESYNVADEKDARSWETKWPEICSYFGLKGTPPPESTLVGVATYIAEHIDTWHQLEEKHQLRTGIADSDLTIKGWEDFLFTHFNFDRQYDMEKMYGTGFTEERGTLKVWGGVFSRLKKAKIIPSCGTIG